MAKMAYDSVVDSDFRIPVPGVPPPQGGGASVRMDQYQVGQVVGQVAHNLQRIYGLLNDRERFPEHPQSDADRVLASMKSALQKVADAQERSLNLLSGEYETAALNALFSHGDNSAGVLSQASIGDKKLELGDPILTSPGSPSLPVGGASEGGTSGSSTLFTSTPFGHVATAIAISQNLTGNVENQVLSAVLPGVDRCRD
jgi:hypothetical protein